MTKPTENNVEIVGKYTTLKSNGEENDVLVLVPKETIIPKKIRYKAARGTCSPWVENFLSVGGDTNTVDELYKFPNVSIGPDRPNKQIVLSLRKLKKRDDPKDYPRPTEITIDYSTDGQEKSAQVLLGELDLQGFDLSSTNGSMTIQDVYNKMVEEFLGVNNNIKGVDSKVDSVGNTVIGVGNELGTKIDRVGTKVTGVYTKLAQLEEAQALGFTIVSEKIVEELQNTGINVKKVYEAITQLEQCVAQGITYATDHIIQVLDDMGVQIGEGVKLVGETHNLVESVKFEDLPLMEKRIKEADLPTETYQQLVNLMNMKRMIPLEVEFKGGYEKENEVVIGKGTEVKFSIYNKTDRPVAIYEITSPVAFGSVRYSLKENQFEVGVLEKVSRSNDSKRGYTYLVGGKNTPNYIELMPEQKLDVSLENVNSDSEKVTSNFGVGVYFPVGVDKSPVKVHVDTEKQNFKVGSPTLAKVGKTLKIIGNVAGAVVGLVA